MLNFLFFFLRLAEKINPKNNKHEEFPNKLRIIFKNLSEINPELLLNNKEYKIFINGNPTDINFKMDKSKIDLKNYCVGTYFII